MLENLARGLLSMSEGEPVERKRCSVEDDDDEEEEEEEEEEESQIYEAGGF